LVSKYTDQKTIADAIAAVKGSEIFSETFREIRLDHCLLIMEQTIVPLFFGRLLPVEDVMRGKKAKAC
jgi:hypothetical protein